MAAGRVGDAARSSAAWTKELLHSDHGDSFSLLRLQATARLDAPGSIQARFLVLDGRIDVVVEQEGRRSGRQYRRGAYFGVPEDGHGVLSSAEGCLVLLISGVRLGEPAEDVFSPDGWQEAGPGQWVRLLLDVRFDPQFDERIVGVAYLEPGAASVLHDHSTAHRFLYLNGEAEDELVFPDGSRETAHRAQGDFVDYLYPIRHRSFSRTGCTIFFVHEPLR